MIIALETTRLLRAVTPQNTIVEAQHVGRCFMTDNGTELTAFDSTSFNPYEGEIVAILGRSGADKSIFLRALAELTKPTSGTVKYRGKALTGPDPGIALVFQTLALMPWFAVQDNVELGLKARDVPRAERTKLALDAIDMIGLDGSESAHPKELSGGMRQHMGTARALVLRPDALFMDEPFSALGVSTAEDLRQKVLKLWSSEQHNIKSVSMVTHNIEKVVEMADRVVVLGSYPRYLIVDVRADLQRPCDRHSTEFETMMNQLYAILIGQASQPMQQTEALSPSTSLTNASVTDASVMDVSDLQPAKTIEKVKEHPLPNAMPGEFAGLLDVVAEHPHGIDLADLASAPSFEVDDLLPLVDAGTMLHVIVVCDDHMQITETGDSWHKADILRVEQMFASLAMEYVPLVHNIEYALRRLAGGKFHGELIPGLLRVRYTNDEAYQQFAIAVEQGRYGELFDYDADDGLLSLDEANRGE